MLLFVAAPLLAAAAPSWQQQAVASATPFIEKANHEWTSAIVSGDLDVLAAPYAENAVFVLPDGTTIRGRAGVRALYAKRPPDPKMIHATLKSEGRVAVDPDDVYEWGSAQETLQSKGKTRQRTARYLTVWHRSGKQWLITRNLVF